MHLTPQRITHIKRYRRDGFCSRLSVLFQLRLLVRRHNFALIVAMGVCFLSPLAIAKDIPMETVLHRFIGGDDGLQPQGGVVFDSFGNLFGTTVFGGWNDCFCGTVYEMSKTNGSWKKTVLYSFIGDPDGLNPIVPPTLDANGNLYETATASTSGHGAVYKLRRTRVGWAEGFPI
jgi:hypothetical protein